jgi:hypothetical protein
MPRGRKHPSGACPELADGLIAVPPVDERRTIVQTSLVHEEKQESTPSNNQKTVLSREESAAKQHDHSDIS